MHTAQGNTFRGWVCADLSHHRCTVYRQQNLTFTYIFAYNFRVSKYHLYFSISYPTASYEEELDIEVLDKLLQQRAKIKNALTEVIAFEDALGNITEKPLDSTNLVTYKISQLSTEFPFLDWTAFFHSAFKEVVDLTLLSPDTEVLIQVCFVQLFATIVIIL